MKAFFKGLKDGKGGKDGKVGVDGSGTSGSGPSVSRANLSQPSATAGAAPVAGAEVYPNAKAQDFLARYEVGATVGVGGFAVVKKCRDKQTDAQLAVKIVDRSRYSTGDNSLAREIEVLTQIDHPNCIKLFAVYLTERKVTFKRPFLVSHHQPQASPNFSLSCGEGQPPVFSALRRPLPVRYCLPLIAASSTV